MCPALNYTGGRPFRNTPFSQHFFDEFVFCLGTPFRNTSLDQKDFRPANWQKWTKMTKNGSRNATIDAQDPFFTLLLKQIFRYLPIYF